MLTDAGKVLADDVLSGCSFISAVPHHHICNVEGFYICAYSGLWLTLANSEEEKC